MSITLESANTAQTRRDRLMHLTDTTTLLLMSNVPTSEVVRTLTTRYGIPEAQARIFVEALSRLIEQ